MDFQKIVNFLFGLGLLGLSVYAWTGNHGVISGVIGFIGAIFLLVTTIQILDP